MSGQQLRAPQAATDENAVAIGDMAWQALRDRAIPPTPRNFELLFRHFSSSTQAHSERQGSPLSPVRTLPAGGADVLPEERSGMDAHADAIDAGAEGIAEAAQDIVEQVNRNQDALTGYGNVLAQWADRMTSPASVDDLVMIMANLSAETGRAAERNRFLERQLSASTARIAKLRQNLIEVRQESTIDALTGVANRKAFNSKLRRLIAQARADSSIVFSLVMLDIDHFKTFNDRHGHRTGDQVLRLVGRLLSDNVKGRDTAARYGGEEFAILLAGADMRAGLTVAEQVRKRLSSQSLIKRGTGETIGQIAISAGVAQHRPGERGADLVERADRALYEAKRTGRNRVCAAPDHDALI